MACRQQYILEYVTKTQLGRLLLETVTGAICNCSRILKFVLSGLVILTTRAKGRVCRSRTRGTSSPIAFGMDQGKIGCDDEKPIAWLSVSILRGCLGSSMPLSLVVNGRYVLKKPSLHESGQKRSIAPVARVQATTA